MHVAVPTRADANDRKFAMNHTIVQGHSHNVKTLMCTVQTTLGHGAGTVQAQCRTAATPPPAPPSACAAARLLVGLQPRLRVPPPLVAAAPVAPEAAASARRLRQPRLPRAKPRVSACQAVAACAAAASLLPGLDTWPSPPHGWQRCTGTYSQLQRSASRWTMTFCMFDDHSTCHRHFGWFLRSCKTGTTHSHA